MTTFRLLVIALLACVQTALFGAVKNRSAFVPIKFHGYQSGMYSYRVFVGHDPVTHQAIYETYWDSCHNWTTALNGKTLNVTRGYTEASLPYGTTNLEPYKVYSANVGGLEATTDDTTRSGYFKAIAPPGYRVELNGFVRDRFAWSGEPLYSPIKVRVIEDGSSYDGPVATASEIESGRIRWQVSLGGLSDGRHAGNISLIGHGRGDDWSIYCKASALSYEQISSAVYVYSSGGSIRQIYAPQAFADVTENATALTIKFYHPDQIKGSSYPKAFDGVPFETYTITKGATATSLKIVRETRDVLSDTDMANVSATSKTSLVRSGAGPDFTWVQEAWMKETETTAHSEETRTWVANGADGFTETLTLQDPHDGVPVFEQVSTMKQFSWGGELPIETTSGAANPEVDYSSYYEDAADMGSYGGVRLSKDVGGGWQYIEYAPSSDAANVGNVLGVYSPFMSGPAAPEAGAIPLKTSGIYTQYTYSSDPFKMKRRLASAETKVNDILVSKVVNTYENVSVNDKQAVRITRTQSTDSGTGVLTSISVHYREDVSSYFYRNQLHSTTAPDGTRKSYVRQLGTLDTAHKWGNPETPSAYTFTSASSSSKPVVLASRICVISGLAADPGGTPAATKLSSQYGYTVTAVWLVHARSTMDVTIRDYMGRVLRSETRIWNRPGSASGVWEVASWKDYYYDRASRLVKTIDNTGSTYEAGYAGGLKTWEHNADGSYLEYAYDNANRLWKSTAQAKGNVGSRVTEYKYDAIGNVVESKIYDAANPTGETILSSTAFDTAGRVTSAVKDGVAVAGYAYDPVNRTTTKVPPEGGATITEYYIDGQLKSVTGTGSVASYNAYGVETDGRVWASVSLGAENSGRYTKSWKDWIGREVRKETPGFTGQPTIVEIQTYHTTKGLLVKKTKGVVEAATDRRTVADTLYAYDAFGAAIRSGLDVNANGSLDLAGPDTVSGSSPSYFKDSSGDWWSQTRSYGHLTTGSAAETTTGVTRTRLSGFSGSLRAEIKTYGPETNFSNLSSLDEVDYKREWTEIYWNTGKVLTYVKQPHLAANACDTTYNGLVTLSDGADGITISKGYDGLWRLTSTTDPRTGASTRSYKQGTTLLEVQYDARGEENGKVASFQYDSMGRVTCQTNANGHATRTAYTPRGEVWRVWGGGTLPSQTEYDDFGMRETLTTYRSAGDDPIWNGETWPSAMTGDVSTWSYDLPSGLLWKQTDAKNRVVEYLYDERGQLYQRKWARKVSAAPDSEQVTTTYDYMRRPLGSPSIEYFDGGTSPSMVSYNDGGATPNVIYGPVDRSGNPSNVQDFAGTRAFNYDSSKPWRGLNNVDLPSAFYGQRKFSRVLEGATNTAAGTYGEHALATFKGRIAGFSLSAPGSSNLDLKQIAHFSDKGRFAGVELPLTPRNYLYGYKANSALLSGYSVSDLAFAVSYGYEAHRDLMAQVSNRWGVLRVLSQFDYVYDSLGQRDTLAASGETIQQEHGASLFTDFNYDGRGQLLSAKVGRGGDLLRPLPGRQFGFSYDTIGNRLTSTRTTTAEADTYTPNNLNQIDQRTNRFFPVSGLATSLARVAVHDQLAARSGNYWHASLPNPVDPANNVPSYVDIAVSAATIATSTGGKDTAQTEQRPLIFPPSVETLTHDEDGNLQSDGSSNYTWDAENRLIQVEPKAIAGAPASLLRKRVTFRYDYLSRRIEKKVESAAGTGTPAWQLSEWSRFLYQGWNLFAEFSVSVGGTPTLSKSYTWGLDLGGALTASGGVGALLQIRNHATGVVHLPAYDAGGNVTSLADASNGAIVAAYEYGPFGELVSIRGSAAATNPFRFSTKFCDNETGLYYYGYRYYDPQNGRFINRDPLGDKGGLNLYAFVGNSPITGFDVWGLYQDEFSSFDASYASMSASDQAAFNEGFSSGSAAFYSSTIGVFQEAADFGLQSLIGLASMAYTVPMLPDAASYEDFGLYEQATAPQHEFTAAWSQETSAFLENSYAAITPDGYNDARQEAAQYTSYVYAGTTLAEAGLSLFSKGSASLGRAATEAKAAGALDDFKFDVGKPSDAAKAPATFRASAEFWEEAARLESQWPAQIANIEASGAFTAMKPVPSRMVDITKLSPPVTQPFAVPEKLARMGEFDWSKYQAITVFERNGILTIENGMTRVQRAREAGIKYLPAKVYHQR